MIVEGFDFLLIFVVQFLEDLRFEEGVVVQVNGFLDDFKDLVMMFGGDDVEGSDDEFEGDGGDVVMGDDDDDDDNRLCVIL